MPQQYGLDKIRTVKPVGTYAYIAHRKEKETSKERPE